MDGTEIRMCKDCAAKAMSEDRFSEVRFTADPDPHHLRCEHVPERGVIHVEQEN